MKIIIYMFLSLIALSAVIAGSYFLFNPSIEIPSIKLSSIESAFFDKPSPSNWVKEEQIQIYDDKIIILIPRATVSRYAATKSMDPSIDANANGIEIVPESFEQLHVGDIVAYSPDENSNTLIVHRIIETGIDENGWYCITRGDNALQSDGKIRFNQIRYVTIAIIY